MKKVIYEVSQSERDRIIQMHESATKNQYVKILKEEGEKVVDPTNVYDVCKKFFTNDSTTLYDGLGVLNLCATTFTQIPITEDEVSKLVDWFDDKKYDEISKWIKGEQDFNYKDKYGILRTSKGIPLKYRYFTKNSKYYPCVEKLRADYNEDEGGTFGNLFRRVKETLSNESLRSKTDIYSLFLGCYTYWYETNILQKALSKQKEEEKHKEEVEKLKKEKQKPEEKQEEKPKQETKTDKSNEKKQDNSDDKSKKIENNKVTNTQQKKYSYGEEGFNDFCKDKGYTSNGMDADTGFFVTSDGNEYRFNDDTNTYQPK